MSTAGVSIQARDVGVVLSRKARTLLSARAMNDLVREALIHGGEEWIAAWLPRRFERSYASLLGYATSQRKSRTGLTYDERKRQTQGHADPLVWTGRLRAQAIANARATATATRGEARGRITFGRLAVQGAAGEFRAPPPVVVSTLLGGPSRRLPAGEIATVRDGFLAYAVATLEGLTAPTAKPLFPPSVIMDRRAQRWASQRSQLADAERKQAAIGTGARERFLRTRARWQAARGDVGGSSPIGVAAMTPSERRIRHRAQSLASYRRRARIVNIRRRMRRRLAA